MPKQTFHGKTMSEAFEKVRRTMGQNALIIRQRMIPQKGLLGLGGTQVAEITAWDEKVAGLRKVIQKRKDDVRRNHLLDKVYKPAQPEPDKAQHPVESSMIQQELDDLRKVVSDLSERVAGRTAPKLLGHLKSVYERMIANDVPDKLAKGLVERISQELAPENTQDYRLVLKTLRRYLCRLIRCGTPLFKRNGRAHSVAFIGPTGVGKTTTIAKIAAGLVLNEGKRVGLVTLDTYRMKAADQLKGYARILRVPLEVVSEPEEFGAVMRRLSDMDYILIDTAGRNHRDAQKMAEMESYFDVWRPDELHLVISATSSERIMAGVLKRYAALPVNNIVLTKLDETDAVGAVLSMVARTSMPISYLTDGQNVPEDIEVCNAKNVVKMFLGVGMN